MQVIQHYREEGFQFLLRAFNQPHYLEDITGLTQLKADTLDSEVTIVTCYHPIHLICDVTIAT